MITGEFGSQQDIHFNGLEGFLDYFKRRRAAKGGISRDQLPLGVAEHMCRYDSRQLSIDRHIKQFLKLLQKCRKLGG